MWCFAVSTRPEDFLARLDSLLPVMRASALPEVSLPSSFEQHCPGGLSALAAKVRAVWTQARSRPADATGAGTKATASVVTGEERLENHTAGAHKRQRSGSDNAAGPADNRDEMLGFGDEMVGTAAAIAMFGWQSAPATVPVGGSAAASPTEGSSSNGSTVAIADGGARTTAKSPERLICDLCKRRLVTDNFLTLTAGPSSGVGCTGAGTGAEESPGALSSPEGREGRGRSGKRRRLSGGGTPLKPMDLVVEHRSFCPWATVHPPVAGVRACLRVLVVCLVFLLAPSFCLIVRVSSVSPERHLPRGNPKSAVCLLLSFPHGFDHSRLFLPLHMVVRVMQEMRSKALCPGGGCRWRRSWAGKTHRSRSRCCRHRRSATD